MAGNSLRRLWSWISFVILPGCLLLSNTERAPCAVAYPSNVTEDDFVPPPPPEAEVIVFLRESCDGEANVTDIQDFFDRSNYDARITVIPASLSCETKTRGLDALLRVLGQRTTKALVAALDSPMCDVTAKLAHLWNVPLFTWTCPLKDPEEKEFTSIVRLSPSLPTIAKALAEMLMSLQWKSVSVIGTGKTSAVISTRKVGIRRHVNRRSLRVNHPNPGAVRSVMDHRVVFAKPNRRAWTSRASSPIRVPSDSTLTHIRKTRLLLIPNSIDREPWMSLHGALLNAFRGIGVALRYRVILPYRAPVEEIRKILRPMYNVPRRVTVLCLPASDNELTSRVLTELDNSARQSSSTSYPGPWNSMIVVIHTEDDDLFLPRLAPTAPISLADFTSLNNYSASNVSRQALSDDGMYEIERVETIEEAQQPRSEREKKRTLFPPKSISPAILEKLLIVTPLDGRYDAEKIYEGTERYAIPTLFDRLNETLNILTYDNSSINIYNNKMYTYVLLDWRIDVWKPIMITVERRGTLHARKLSVNAVAFNKAKDADLYKCNANVNADVEIDVDDDVDVGVGADCAENPTDDDESAFRTAHIISIVLGSLLLTIFAILLAILIRKKLLKKRMSKGPYKIILTTTDFVFPQVPRIDSRRVDEGIETMLCCWLQQLQEFGGPEVEKPDLLQLGSVSSLRPYLRASTGNLARHNLFKDPQARYNGDLVQLKELPTQGTFELRSKSMDVLVMIHGLRHENLNPLIGCLNEPTRPCLVYEYCSRGSLEDVLMQDEIKLDWSFRLSLLTDLVRGMRYLHGTPIRVHGYLTSRNCVIDARWVLKVTDYGLPAFYEAQNIVPPTKTARDLLWAAPELLRHPNLRKRGSQAGDVYSFGIIMQEVVVRGEPFCMLALSPEDIIEKVMRPPPLIRPSVSKGAAPPEAINIMRQCWAEAADMRPHFDDVHDLFKKLNHGRKVNFVDTMFQMLEKYSNNLEELIRERTEQLDMEKKKTEQLLNRMLPSMVAEKLKLGMPVDPEEFREVTIYFSDIVGFTSISAHSTPFQVVDLLNDLYTCFDATINAYTVYKVETIGDAYMVVGGCPVRIPDHASQIAMMALDLLHQSGKFKLRHLPKTQLRLRIGLHTGPCCAGVVGLTMPRYCLFGDTVNTASRMESTGAPWRIHLSQATRDRLTQVGGYRIEYRGSTEIKGKGKMPTYWLLGKQGFDKDLPTPPPLGENHGLNENLVIPENLTSSENAVISDDRSSNTRRSRDRTRAGRGQEEEEEEQEEDDNRGRDAEVDEDATRGEKILDPSCSPNSSSADIPKSVPPKEASDGRENDRVHPATLTRTTVGDDTQPSLRAPTMISGDATALGASTSSLTSIPSSVPLPYRPGPARHRLLPGHIDENDLSTPYNHYRCLSPNEHHGRSTGSRFLKRQFSLDRPDDTVCVSFIEPHNRQQQQQNLKATPRLYKQNSAGAANDLERIEEVPSTPARLLQHYRQAASVSLSVESLTLH